MAFDGHHSLFSTYHRQASVNVGGGNNGSVVLPLSIPSVSLQEQDAASYVPWSHNAHDDPYGLISCTQSSTESRKPTDKTDCDGEIDLQGLVSNIVDEADSQDGYYIEGGLPTCNPVWSPKTLREELLQYFKSEAKTQHNPTFPSNYVSREALGKAQGQSVGKDVQDFCQQSDGPAASHPWFFNLPNGDRDNYTLRPQKLPPGLPIPNIGNTYLSQVQQRKYDNRPADKDRGDSQPLNNFPDLSDVFRPQCEMNSSCLHPCYEDHFTHSSAKLTNSEQYVPQDINQLVSSFQSFMAGEQDGLCRGDFPNMHRQTVGRHHEDSIFEQWKITSPTMSTQSTPAVQTPKQLLGEFGTVHMERHGGLRNQAFKCDAFQDLPGFSPQNTEYFIQPKPFSGSFNLPNQYQNKMHRENTSLSINMRKNHYPKHHTQQGQIQSKIKSQIQKEKKRMNVSGFLGEGFSTRPPTNSNMRGGDKKQALSQNLYFDHMGGMQYQRFNGENSMVSAGNTQQLMPHMYPVNDPRRHTSVPTSCSNFSSRSTLPYESGAPGMDIRDMMSASESAAFNSYVSDTMSRRGESTYHGMASAMTPSVMMNQGGPVIQLYFYLDKCLEQWRYLEKERKRFRSGTLLPVSTTLQFHHGGKKNIDISLRGHPYQDISWEEDRCSNQHQPTQNSTKPTRVDHLIVNQMKEQARVGSLLDRMECLCNISLHISIHTALNRHHMAICITQARRKEELANMSKHQRQRAHFTEDRDTLLLVIALKDLAATTRKLRTALWCALQITLPQPVKRQDHHVYKEATCTERCTAPFEGYSFKL